MKDGNVSKLREQPKYEFNPYVYPDGKAVTIYREGSVKILSSDVDMDPGKVRGMVKVQEVDNEKFVKIYTSQVSAWFELTVTAQKVLQYVMMVIPRNRDVVHIHVEKAMAFTGYSSTVSVYEGINELINKRIIARSSLPYFYFINPRFLFNGDRVIFAEAIVRNPQAIHERDTVLDSLEHPENGSPDVKAEAVPDAQGVNFYEKLLEMQNE